MGSFWEVSLQEGVGLPLSLPAGQNVHVIVALLLAILDHEVNLAREAVSRRAIRWKEPRMPSLAFM